MLNINKVFVFVGLNLDQILFGLFGKSLEYGVPADAEVSFICFQYERLRMNSVVGV